MKITSSYLKTALVLIFLTIYPFLLSQRIAAQTISNQIYTIQGGDIEEKTLTNPKDPGNKTAYGNDSHSQPFSFSISSNIIDYGPLTPTNPVYRTIDLVISKGSSRGYSVFAFANRELSDVNNNSIPDTTCDNGTCSETSSAQWSGNLSFGFGYRCEIEAPPCSKDFLIENSFKQFANDSKSEPFRSILNGIDYKKAQIKFKVNISGTQARSNYSNTITFIAVPAL
ncbi:MAG: hypothetical protein A3H50_03305 [Candidatus Levybacteria bacterium RIFCSPLOWO2_02_FULL_37_10]|nr:MAG: hypothetical protein A2860_03030 [Candidatus Levybacteria bacterium RIFCSPHIGHO2_01_FULL_37_33]OGH16250.1 MAG: hypothetical protein A3C97_03020 [Candidatus Levybacteria bacterium RIFCSPHIGHO2_02_FULL_37_11]OGH29509.1 MAG: hypothetical protein A3F30_02655 [Candidatus Levybacteria bacterium RIFCSPHIGHO2_12_FULL_37_12]OGH43621.1 MAG: hypothetical protein A3H50_03305 [Candidatus Levybacteria bacterium RIFCSPLOWO2_02_FULL_37_10]